MPRIKKPSSTDPPRPRPTAPPRDLNRLGLDDQGRLNFGKYKGRLAADIVRDDRSYVEWVVGNLDWLSDWDRNALLTMLDHPPSRS